MALKIVEFTKVFESDYLDYIKEWENSEETIVPFASKRNNMSFKELLRKWAVDETDAMYELGFVPATLYFMVDNNNRILGAIHFRHDLNERLLQGGGHIGYGIRPSERRKGYATLMLNLLLENIKLKGYEKVLISCDDGNIGSARTIEKGNGVLYDKVEFEGDMTRRYWVDLKTMLLLD